MVFGFSPLGVSALGEYRRFMIHADQKYVTSNNVIQLPVNCVLSGQQPLRARGNEWEIWPSNVSTKTVGRRSGVRRSGPAPSFTTTTNNRGY